MWKQECFLVQFRLRPRAMAKELIQCSKRSTFGNESVIQKRCGIDASSVFGQESTPSRVPISTACPRTRPNQISSTGNTLNCSSSRLLTKEQGSTRSLHNGPPRHQPRRAFGLSEDGPISAIEMLGQLRNGSSIAREPLHRALPLPAQNFSSSSHASRDLGPRNVTNESKANPCPNARFWTSSKKPITIKS